MQTKHGLFHKTQLHVIIAHLLGFSEVLRVLHVCIRDACENHETVMYPWGGVKSVANDEGVRGHILWTIIIMNAIMTYNLSGTIIRGTLM